MGFAMTICGVVCLISFADLQNYTLEREDVLVGIAASGMGIITMLMIFRLIPYKCRMFDCAFPGLLNVISLLSLKYLTNEILLSADLENDPVILNMLMALLLIVVINTI